MPVSTFSPTERLSAVLVLPARNEAGIIEGHIAAAHRACVRHLPAPWELVVVENGSSDQTYKVAREAARVLERVTVLCGRDAGKGGAIRTGWQQHKADLFFFTDADLPADLDDALPRALAAFKNGASVVVGSRRHPLSQVERGALRRTISAGYRVLARAITGTSLSDLPCGFKAVTAAARDRLLARVEDNGWFFDSELVLLAEAANEHVVEIPVIWRDRPRDGGQSGLPIIHTSLTYLRKLITLSVRLRRMKR